MVERMKLTIEIKIGDRVKIWVQGQPAPVWVEVLEQDEKGFPTKCRSEGERRETFARSRVNYALMVFQPT